jgi:acyl carrier protein
MPATTTQPTLDKVVFEFETVFRNKGLEPPALIPETVLDGSLGLESLDFAELVIRLEQVFGKDPFSQDPIPEVRTLSDLCLLYEAAA